MYNETRAEIGIASRHFILISIVLVVTMVIVLAISAGWAVQRIDKLEKTEEIRALSAALAREGNLLVVEQKSSTVWDESVHNLRANNQSWIAENLVDWMGEFYTHDRVYVVAPDGRVVRAAVHGEYSGEEFDPRDEAAVEPMLQDIRQRMTTASVGLSDSTTAIAKIGIFDTVRLSDNNLAFVSIQPVVGTSSAAAQHPGTEFLHVSVKVLQAQLLSNLSEQLGLADLKVSGPNNDRASLTMRNANGQQLGHVTWTPHRPALELLRETAPATLGSLLLGATSLLGLLIWLGRATTQLVESRARSSFLALHDPLTGLANRALFQTRLEEALGYVYLAASKVLLISIDLDRFKEINDTMGHAVGDQLLQQVAKRLSQPLSEDATLTRLGGDEFVLVQPGMVSDEHAIWLCQSLLNMLKEPFKLDAGLVHLTASFGVAVQPGDAVSAQELLRQADIALYAAKTAGRNRFAFYTPAMDRTRREKRTLEVDLRNALISGAGLYLLYQPIFAAETGEIHGAEALVRWQHPTRGSLSPDDFIGIAEETANIAALGLWVLDEACRFAAACGLGRVAVNVSPLQFLDPRFPDQVLETLRRRDLDPSALELEITEGLFLNNSVQVQQALIRLREEGVSIALDDFGTGYSSISYLRTYNVDKLKIDKSYTRQMIKDQATRTIVQSVVEMAHALGMTVTVEGVEEEAQQRILRELGCNYLQGFLLSRPLTGERLTELWTSRRIVAKTGTAK
ncbi:bifunctional diguanylate cyclase/phosphodiesterase [Devosia sp. J2-20]|uniref:bifunctional diguanylate cyclase/phosphodiesterase n=1 Tax=Devosia sp. J2-20 TaxID=3026161 RepID=UPI00249B82AB|nr:bifunctional diguanylate cyclase/phosphodiesterase [Devosia sp. J2-20]WDQ98206.1 bifunctional diguanylate cyclase/phosphodiesterase [Devosia sp. J2-20]